MNQNLNKNSNNNQGIALLLSMAVMGIVLALVGYFLQFVLTDYKIAKSHSLAAKTYYLAEAGLMEAIWKITNDADWNNNFKTNPSWQATLAREDVFGSGNSYTVNVTNLELAKAEVIATSHIATGDSTSQRIVKTTVFQAQGQAATSGIAIFTEQDLNLSNSIININNGGTFSGDDLILTGASNLTMDENARAMDQITVNWDSQINAPNKESANFPPTPEDMPMPQIDFDSADLASLKNQASALYTTGQFNQLLNGGGANLVLNGIIYVTGNAIIPRGKTVTINGALVTDGHITLGDQWMPFWLSNPSLIINDPGSGPTGLISKRKITLGAFAGTVTVNGLLYAEDEFKLDAYGLNLNLNGGIIAGKMSVNSLWQNLTLNYNGDLIYTALGEPGGSPIINVEHWEEEY